MTLKSLCHDFVSFVLYDFSDVSGFQAIKMSSSQSSQSSSFHLSEEDLIDVHTDTDVINTGIESHEATTENKRVLYR